MKYLAILATASLAAAPALAADKDWKFGDGQMPERWSTVNSDYAICDAGLMQSPVDLGQAKARGEITVSTNYGETGGTLAVSDQKLQVDFPAGMHMHSGDKHFNLIQVHFHTPSEHAINGKRYPLVAHFVHATDKGELGVLGVMFEEGDANPALGAIGNALSSGNGSALNLDASEMIPDDLSVYRYMGSLTTPPCSEGVNWHVAEEVMEASAEQIAAMAGSLGPTARSLQPLGNRLLVAPVE
ncbi:carbonic anhydrase family protein [Altererythrobacter arenosus]|uniref:carbonic anhydrase n=1 Tax=Altererythrobacter arenosus TaxID=3032592 RepID=A0ABY8FPH8_9SPHN|nr:carbonic anhydrase family protein [Altererythrobacter sp. CAU 1644]WFL76916.1 carbonic anhydrase family protein [Altererythrobacter sp. CAU 1644]